MRGWRDRYAPHLILGCGLFIVVAALALKPAPPITVDTSFHFGFAPATVRVRVQIDPHPENRVACLEWDGGIYGRSCWQLDATYPRTTWRELQNLTAGEYLVTATVWRSERGGERFQSQLTFEVINGGP